MPRTKKPAGQTVDSRNGRRTELTAAPSLSRFDPPTDLCSEARAQWDAFWSDPVSQAPTEADRGVILRWIQCVNRYVLAVETADADPVSVGSMGQTIVSPFYKIAEQALAAIERCEAQMGIGAKNRAALGLAIITEKRSLAEVNAHYREASSANGNEAAEAVDPRIQIVKGAVA